MAVIKRYLQKLDPQKYSEEALKEAKSNYWKKKAASYRAQQAAEPAAVGDE
ncbi:hypothetical protein D3C83_219640 [compost metagenome]